MKLLLGLGEAEYDGSMARILEERALTAPDAAPAVAGKGSNEVVYCVSGRTSGSILLVLIVGFLFAFLVVFLSIDATDNEHVSGLVWSIPIPTLIVLPFLVRWWRHRKSDQPRLAVSSHGLRLPHLVDELIPWEDVSRVALFSDQDIHTKIYTPSVIVIHAKPASTGWTRLAHPGLYHRRAQRNLKLNSDLFVLLRGLTAEPQSIVSTLRAKAAGRVEIDPDWPT
jgi:uncharacterized integral membrane protein